MSLQGDLETLFVEHAAVWGLLVVAVMGSIVLRKRNMRGWAFVLWVVAIACIVAYYGSFFGAFGTVLYELWTPILVVGTAALFFAGIWVLVRLARRHADDDPGAMAKVMVAVVVSVLLGAGSFYLLYDFQNDAADGIHATMVEGAHGIMVTLGENDYQEAGKTIEKRIGATGSIPTILLPKLARINATLDSYFAANPELNATSPGLPEHIQDNITQQDLTVEALKTAQEELTKARLTQRMLAPNHALWLKLEPILADGRDDEAERLIMKSLDPAHVADDDVLPLNAATVASGEAPCARDPKDGACTVPWTPKALEHSFFDAHEVRNIPFEEGGPAAFEHQREYNEQMDLQLKLFAYASITGLVMAPFAFAGGAILRRAFVPSDTVGFKPYPSKSAGFFLLFMGLVAPFMVGVLGMAPTLEPFSLVAIPFAAWVLRDLHKRSTEGQISL